MLRFVRIALFCALAGIVAVGCGSTRDVERVDPSTQTDLTGRWNDTDAQRVATDMIDDIMSSAWLTEYENEDQRPVLIVGPIRNNTMQHIDEEIFIKDLERELIESGKVDFVAARDERRAIRKERSDQQVRATPETAARMAQETGADYMVVGTISSEVEESLDRSKMTMFYVVNLELINIESTTVDWIGTKKVKKIVRQDKVTM
jgi:uncharacterized protein (TIGR02722 family)